MNKYPFFVILVFLSFPVCAELYKCQSHDKTLYQESPCSDAAEIQIDTSRLADESAQAAKRRQKEQAEIALHPRKLVIGMSSRDVLKAWGRPTEVNKSVYPGHIHEQWVYRSNRYSRNAYIDNGFLTSYQQ